MDAPIMMAASVSCVGDEDLTRKTTQVWGIEVRLMGVGAVDVSKVV